MKNFIIFIVLFFLFLSELHSDWTPVDSGSIRALYFKIACFDTNNCVVLGDAILLNSSEARVTSDGGKSWKVTLTDDTVISYKGKKLYPSSPNDIVYPSKNTCIIVCDSGNIWVSKNQAQTWEKSCLPTNGIISNITMYDENFGGLLTAKLLYLTFDGGKNWDSVEVKPQDYQYFPSGLQYLQITEDSVIIINAYRPDKESYILRSLDLGKTWDAFPKTPFRIGYILFFNKDVGWATGTYKVASNTKSDVIFKTTDGGATWVKKLDTLIQSNTHGLRKVLFSDKKHGLAFGEHSYIWRTNDSGETWQIDTSFSSYIYGEILNDIAMPSATIQYGVQLWWKKTFKYTSYPTNIEHIEPNENILLYPNPISVGNKLYLKLHSDFPDNYSLTLFNALGQKVGNEYKPQMSNSINLEYDTSGLQSGIYFLSIQTRGKSIMKSFIVE